MYIMSVKKERRYVHVLSFKVRLRSGKDPPAKIIAFLVGTLVG